MGFKMKIVKSGVHELIKDHFVDVYKTDTGCKILIGKEGTPIKRWHLSISHPNRYPVWEEIKQARYDLLSRTKDFAMILPKEDDYVNIHPNCFHLWEIVNGELDEAIDRR